MTSRSRTSSPNDLQATGWTRCAVLAGSVRARTCRADVTAVADCSSCCERQVMALVGPSSVLVCLALTVVGCLLGATVLYPVVVGCTGARRDSIEAVPEAQAGVDGSADRVAAIAVWHPSRLTPGDAFGTTAVTDAMVVTGPIAQSLWASIDRCRRGDEGLLLECSPDRMLQAVLLDGGEKQVGLSSREACGRMVVVDGRWH